MSEQELAAHYRHLAIEPLEYIEANHLDFLEGNIIKYVSRYKFKAGVTDLEKAQVYLARLIEREKSKASPDALSSDSDGVV